MTLRPDSGEDPGPSSVTEESRTRRFELTPDDRDFLVAMAHRLCRSAVDPHDLVQDVLERAVKHAATIPTDDPRPWLVRVMRNLFIDRVRQQQRGPRQADLDDAVVAAPEPTVRAWWQDLEPGDIRARLSELPDELASTFALFAFDGLSYDEIARRQGISKNTVGTRVLRARRRLRALFGGGGDV